MRIGIDIDDTICDSWKAIASTMCKDFNLDYDCVIQSKKTYNHITNISDEEYRAYSKVFKQLLENVDLKKNVRESIKELSNENSIIFITARPDYSFDDAYVFTKNFLDKNNIYYDKIIVNSVDKKQICKEENIDIFIDDSSDNCLSVSELNIKVLMFGNYFNEDEVRFKRVNDWNEILEIVKEENDARKITN